MKTETKYGYQQRIKELEKQVEDSSRYRLVSMRIFNTVCDRIQAGEQISQAWIVRQFSDVMK